MGICLKTPEFYPNLATTAEQGYPTVDHVWWFGISGPPKLPPHILGRWEEALQEMLKDSEFLSRMKKSPGMILYRNPSETREHVKKEMQQAAALWGVK